MLTIMPQVLIQGPEGRIEGHYSASELPVQHLALILHPHPKFGGTMNNKVVYRLADTFRRKGFSVLRFNFRGVGLSQGTHDTTQGDLSVAAACLDWMQQINKNIGECWVAGFSFGSFIGMQLLMRRPEIVGFIGVAPPVNMFDFAFLSPCPAAGLIINGSEDKVVPAIDIRRLADRLKTQRGTPVLHKVIEGAGHFFEDHLDELESNVSAYVDSRKPERDAAVGHFPEVD